MDVRVTGQTQSANAIANLRRQQSAVAKYQDQITSGVRIKVASDDPSAYVAAAQTRRTSERNQTYQNTITSATADLNSSVAALIDGKSILTRAKQIASQSVDSTLDATENEALASEVDTLIDGFLRAANTQSESGHFFSGSNSTTPPFRIASTDANGRVGSVAYDGDSSRAKVLIGPNGQTAETKYVGSNVFQSPGGDSFAALISLRDTLRDNTLTSVVKAAAFTARIGEIESASQRLSNTIGEQAGTLASLDAISSHLVDAKLTADSRLNDLESTDIVDAVIKLKEQEAAFQATVAVSSKLIPASLLDYIR